MSSSHKACKGMVHLGKGVSLLRPRFVRLREKKEFTSPEEVGGERGGTVEHEGRSVQRPEEL